MDNKIMPNKVQEGRARLLASLRQSDSKSPSASNSQDLNQQPLQESSSPKTSISKIVIKRDWNDAFIRIEVDNKGIRIECPLETFERELEDNLVTTFSDSNILSELENVVLENLPSLSFDFKKSTYTKKIKSALKVAYMNMLIGEKIRKVFRKVFNDASRSLKYETVKVIDKQSS